MNIFIVVNSLAGGGAERVALTLSSEFSRQGFNVTIVALQNIAHYPLEDVAENVEVVFLSNRSLVWGGISLATLVNDRRPTHVLCMVREPGMFLSFFRRRKRERWVFREAGPLDALLMKPRWKQLIYKALLRLAYARADLVIANSEGTARSVSQRYELGGKLRVIHNPIPAPDQAFTDRETEDPTKNCRLGKTFISVGRLVPAKGFDILIEAFSKLVAEVSGCRLFILGQGPLETELRDQISLLKMAQNVTLVGFVSDPTPYYKQSDVYVSASRHEGFGNTIVEAMSFGCFPLISSCPGGSTEIIADKSHGRIFEAESVESLTRSLKAVCDMPYDRQSVISRAKDFDAQKIGASYAAAILGRDYYQRAK